MLQFLSIKHEGRHYFINQYIYSLVDYFQENTSKMEVVISTKLFFLGYHQALKEKNSELTNYAFCKKKLLNNTPSRKNVSDTRHALKKAFLFQNADLSAPKLMLF